MPHSPVTKSINPHTKILRTFPFFHLQWINHPCSFLQTLVHWNSALTFSGISLLQLSPLSCIYLFFLFTVVSPIFKKEREGGREERGEEDRRRKRKEGRKEGKKGGRGGETNGRRDFLQLLSHVFCYSLWLISSLLLRVFPDHMLHFLFFHSSFHYSDQI